MGFDIGAGAGISRATLELYQHNNAYGTNYARVYEVSRTWDVTDACWANDGYGSSWIGGEYDSTNCSEAVYLSTTNGWRYFDISHIARTQYYQDSSYLLTRGILIKLENISYNSLYYFYSTNSTSVQYRPRLVLDYFRAPYSGADVGNMDYCIAKQVISQTGQLVVETIYYDDNYKLDARFDRMTEDYQHVARYFVEDSSPHIVHYANEALNNNIGVILVYPVGDVYANSAQFASKLTEHLTYLSSPSGTIPTITRNLISDGAILGIEIGNEEGGKARWIEQSEDPIDQGAAFAEWYLDAWSAIKENPTHRC